MTYQYFILKNVESYDGLFVCYKVTYSYGTNLNNLDVNRSEVLIADADLEVVREYIPDNYTYHKGESRFDPRVVEMWENFAGN